MRLPDFLIIGAARCGTTSLYEYLKHHDQIFLPKDKRPEPHFFLKEEEYKKGLAYYSQKYFRGVAGTKVAGEASTSYFYQAYVAERIKKHLPDIKLIVLLRNPIERAYSNYLVTYKNKIETLSFSQAIRQEKARIANPENDLYREICPFGYIDRGRYYRQLQNYLKYFARQQIHIVFFEDFIKAAEDEIRRLFVFLNVRPDFRIPNIREIYNKNEDGMAPISESDRNFIYQELKEDMTNLSKLLGRDLSGWE